MTILSYLRHNSTMPTVPNELELKPVVGMPRWLGSWATDKILRALSMEEQPGPLRSLVLSPVNGYFRRDRHVHPRIDSALYRLRMSGLARRRRSSLSF